MRLRRWFADNWGVAALTLAMLASLLLGLMESKWLTSADALWLVALAAALLGLLASVLLHRVGGILSLAIITGLLFTVEYHSQALPAPAPAWREVTAEARWLGGEVVRLVRADVLHTAASAPVPPPDAPEWGAAWERLSLYAWNVASGWPPQVVKQQLKINQVLLGSLLGFLVWVISALAVWVTARHRSIWIGLLPLIILQCLSVYFTVKGWPYLILSLASGLLLMSDSSQRRMLSRWREDVVPFGFEVDWWAWAFGVAGIVGVTMLSVIQLTDPETRRWFDDTFFPKPAAAVSSGGSRPGGSSSGVSGLGVMPTQHLLGSGPELSKQTAMLVRTPGVAPAGFYWRAIAYNKYTGHGWIISSVDRPSEEAGPLWPENIDPPEYFALLRQTFRLVSNTSQVYAAGRPVRINQTARGTWLAPAGSDLLRVETVYMQSGYEVLSWVSAATPDELRGASTVYPDWVRDGYLVLPDELPERVKTLTAKITADAPTPYDKALAIQDYLRTYPYTLDLKAPPADRDVVDYFLFDLKRGYCDYYATAMVVMARSAGLPARLAIGFATGRYEKDTDTYRVTLADAHSWAEVYFPRYGWIPFEPTAGFAAPTRGPASEWVREAESAREENIQEFQESTEEHAAPGPSWPLAATLGGAAGLVVIVAAISAYRWRKRRQGTVDQIVGGLYRDLRVSGRRLGISISEAQTPDEFLQSLLAETASRAHRAPHWSGRWEPRLAQVGQDAGFLVSLYSRLAYSGHPLARASAEAALDAWPGLSRRLWVFWLIGLLAPFRRG